ncbi:Pilus assembly protein PilE [Pseudomonas sp. 8Z]|uniref:type IV pilin protein n=1 Tax=Pseudomonas sp. 8Z TaxID=2653166 RepID=UPI0012F26631|nr:type IV pilin protein [Pseudomonas sp. 8Z]VXD02573.1 Pilus assembly protein PilE [Pseudomonas sp. 8Z]
MKERYVRQSGFTLIEVMIVVVIIGILASIAYPNYSEYVKRGNRTEGQAFLNDVAARQERYFAQNSAYITSDANVAKLALKNGTLSDTGKYSLSLSKVDDDGGYTLTAGHQFDDDKCGDLTLDAKGVKGHTGTAASVDDCWR